MFDSSPIDMWEGAAAIFNFAGTYGTVIWFGIMCVLCIIPLYVALRAEQASEDRYDI